ncbi:MAG: DUF4426 domain-containing protein [Arenimonas sp.]|uniref:DUF4426 domain-containing protein n=1 Tax=Arenimonas sp. TaxID=1872635 RepID=UPI0025C062B9|nr:DUF4426 domain-containing protein [Arenimonas sp.]MBW8366454.1 DUF4426 domain-containing protein [Arenimonas sp.]
MHRSPVRTIVLGLFALLLALPAFADNSTRAGGYVVHHNAVPTTSLTPDVARQYGITRSANRALVNISVRQGELGADRAVQASVKLVATNLNGQRLDLRAREVREGDAVYYLAEARITGNDTLVFDLEVTPEGATAPIKASFRQEFFAR